MFPSRLPQHKCRICGVEAELTQVRVHYRTTHPEYERWGNHWRRVSWLLLISIIALVSLDVLIRSAVPMLDYVFDAYFVGSILVMIFTMVSKQRAFREAWHKAHPSGS